MVNRFKLCYGVTAWGNRPLASVGSPSTPLIMQWLNVVGPGPSHLRPQPILTQFLGLAGVAARHPKYYLFFNFCFTYFKPTLQISSINF